MNHKTIPALLAVTLCLLGANALAGDEDALIELDKKWGNATLTGDMDTVAALLSDDLVAISPDGVGGKTEEMANQDEFEEGAVYTPTDFEVTFLDEHTAVMTHSTTGENAHHSLHVWSDKGGSWQVIATANTPAAGE